MFGTNLLIRLSRLGLRLSQLHLRLNLCLLKLSIGLYSRLLLGLSPSEVR
ncbi:hypothetical protein [Streptomyces tibetensis]